jgi:ComF family protein
MPFLRSLCSIFLDALFPISPAEQEMLSMRPEDLWKLIPRAQNFSTKEACSIFSYKDERMRQLVWSIKYKKSPKAAALGGHAIHRMLSIYSSAAGRVIVIPMPITKQRRRERGFNQCELLTDEIAKISRNADLTIISNLLVRTRHKSRQTLKTRHERLESARELFAVNENALLRLKGSEDNLVIVIDDVVTTGSTMREAVNALREAGFKKAFGLSLAH